MTTSDSDIKPSSTMSEVLGKYPGAQRAMFRRYHIGGCASCGFQPTETLEQVCQRNGVDPTEVIQHIKDSHTQDATILISPKDLAALRSREQNLHLLDVRSREEHEAVKIDGAVLLSQPLMQEIMTTWSKESLFVIYDHQGKQGLDAATYFIGHGFGNVKCLSGGIDAWSLEVDPSVQRYRLT